MGFKLQDRIRQMRGIPGKYKRILTAIAQRARNDGTNFYESKETIAEKAGVSRWTAYRAIDGMVTLEQWSRRRATSAQIPTVRRVLTTSYGGEPLDGEPSTLTSMLSSA